MVVVVGVVVQSLCSSGSGWGFYTLSVVVQSLCGSGSWHHRCYSWVVCTCVIVGATSLSSLKHRSLSHKGPCKEVFWPLGPCHPSELHRR